jgi:hypothetical protein
MDGNGYAIYATACDTTFENNEVVRARGGAIQIYVSGGHAVERPIIRNNYVHEMTVSSDPSYGSLCFGIAINGADARIDHNILDLSGCATAASGSGISTGYAHPTSGNSNIHHNIIYAARSASIQLGVFTSGGTTGNAVMNNILVESLSGIAIELANDSQVTASHNKIAGALTDCTVSTTNFAHRAGSPCIDAGTPLAGFAYNGSAPDQGPFETAAAPAPAAPTNLVIR